MNQQLLDAAFGLIIGKPEIWDQRIYLYGNGNDLKCCLAGAVVMLAGRVCKLDHVLWWYAIDKDGKAAHFHEQAIELLNITNEQADSIFDPNHRVKTPQEYRDFVYGVLELEKDYE